MTEARTNLGARATAALYGETAPAAKAPPSVAPGSKFERYAGSAAALYGNRLDSVDQSFWRPRIREAKADDKHILAAALEQQRREFFDSARELKLSESQARRISVVLRDTASRPLTRDKLTEYDELRLQKNYGAKVQDLVTAGYERLGAAFKDRPALLAAVTQGGAWVHREVAAVACELAQSLKTDPSK
jgi:hypothetical protein